MENLLTLKRKCFKFFGTCSCFTPKKLLYPISNNDEWQWKLKENKLYHCFESDLSIASVPYYNLGSKNC